MTSFPSPDDFTSIPEISTSDFIYPPKGEELKCNQYVLQNKTHFIYGGYEGIPENLLINFIAWMILLCLFTILRKTAWNYGRLALVQKYENRWTHIFYGAEKDTSQSLTESDSVSSYEFNVLIDKGYFSWILAIFKIKDEHILAKCGRDAVQYLSFQRHIIVYLMIVCAVCITIILPINFQGSFQGGQKEFGHTTLSNLDPSSPFMWLHVTLAFLFLPLGIFFTRRFSITLEIRELTATISRTLMITRVPRKSCQKEMLLRHFQEAYMDMEVVDIQFAYDIHNLIQLDKERELAHRARRYSEDYLKETSQRLEIRAYKCGLICGCCDMFGCPKVDAISFYTEEEESLSLQVDEEKVRALQKPTGIAFVTLDSTENAKRVSHDHRATCKCKKNPPSSSVSSYLKPYNWIIIAAPSPDDIYWSNLSVTRKNWYLKAFFINLILFMFLFFLTTPAVIINQLDFVFIWGKLTQLSPLLSQFLPTLMLWTIAALMPVMVSYSDQFMSHWTRSAQNHAIMSKTFLFLLFMLVILPSLGFTSAKAFLEWFVDHHSPNRTYRWRCIFLPDNGAFFVNYVITSAFIGTSLELIRFPELFMYMMRLGLARSEAEIPNIRKNILYEFQFGVQYAWMLLIFAMTIIYSVSCPLITPFGLIYMLFKHFVDKYNIYFAYGPSKIRKSIHTTAINFVIVCIIILQLCLLFFSLLRQSLQSSITIYSFVLIGLAFLAFVSHVTFHWFKHFSPIIYKHSTGDETVLSEDRDDPDAVSSEGINGDTSTRPDLEGSEFIPNVLRRTSAGIGYSEGETLINRRSYGTQPSSSGLEGVTSVHEVPVTNYQNYSTQAHVHAEVNTGGHLPPPSEDQEETLYSRQKRSDQNRSYDRKDDFTDHSVVTLSNASDCKHHNHPTGV